MIRTITSPGATPRSAKRPSAPVSTAIPWLSTVAPVMGVRVPRSTTWPSSTMGAVSAAGSGCAFRSTNS